jgi:putative toxin-antitoxin system antitoxin component (TIGR02293 family)
MANALKIEQLLGGPEVLGQEVESRFELVPLVRKGLPYEALESVTRELELSMEETSEALHLPKRTLSRRKEARRLDPLQSERVVRLAGVAAKAMQVLGSHEKAKRWLTRPNRALGGETPVGLLDTDIGAQAVEDVLTRIEQGVFS